MHFFSNLLDSICFPNSVYIILAISFIHNNTDDKHAAGLHRTAPPNTGLLEDPPRLQSLVLGGDEGRKPSTSDNKE